MEIKGGTGPKNIESFMFDRHLEFGDYKNKQDKMTTYRTAVHFGSFNGNSAHGDYILDTSS